MRIWVLASEISSIPPPDYRTDFGKGSPVICWGTHCRRRDVRGCKLRGSCLVLVLGVAVRERQLRAFASLITFFCFTKEMPSPPTSLFGQLGWGPASSFQSRSTHGFNSAANSPRLTVAQYFAGLFSHYRHLSSPDNTYSASRSSHFAYDGRDFVDRRHFFPTS